MASDKFFSDEYLDQLNPGTQTKQGPVTVFGLTFKSEEECRQFFRDELRRRLPELRQIEGFPIGEDEDIINLSDPPFYTACPNPWLNNIPVTKIKKTVNVPFNSDLSSDERHPVYSFHPYHTKVPPYIIEELIKYYTKEGDVVLDIFSGSGMTGVAARETNRNVILCDLAPISTFISAINNQKFGNGVAKVLLDIIKESKKKYGFLYKTVNGLEINYYVWCDVFLCPECCHEFPIFPHGVIHHGNKVETKKKFYCPSCGKEHSIRSIERIITSEGKKRKVVWVNAGSGKQRINREADQFDENLAKKATELLSEFEGFYPKDIIDPNGYSAKLAQLGNKSIDNISKFLSDRNLLIYADLYNRIMRINSTPIKNACLSILTSIFTVVSERQGYFGGGGGMSGNLYMPIVRMEKNIYATMERKIKKYQEVDMYKNRYGGTTFVTTQSSTALDNIKDESIDYIYTDPPFGANIIYSEMNLLLEGWLKVKTNNGEEAIVDETANKTELVYSTLMTECFSQCYRKLKKDHWMSVEFHNTKASIWNILQNSIMKAGFIIAQISKLDKGGTTILADIRPGAAVQDLIISCYKPTSSLEEDGFAKVSTKEHVWEFIDRHLEKLALTSIEDGRAHAVSERNPRILYDRMLSYYILHGYEVPMSMHEFTRELSSRYVERDNMCFTPKQAIEYDKIRLNSVDFVPMGIIVSDEANGIEWIKNQIRNTPKTYKEIQPNWTKALVATRKGDKIPELITILEENFIKNEDDTWRIPNIEDDIDLEKLRTKALLKEFKLYLEVCRKPRGKLKDIRVEAVRAGFKQCYSDKNFADIILVGDRIPQNLLTEDEVLLQYYDIASSKI